MSENPFHSRWYRAWHVLTMPLRLFGFAPVLVRCCWTESNARVGLAWVGLAALTTDDGEVEL